MPDIAPNPRGRAGGAGGGVAMSPGGSLPLSRLRSANEKSGGLSGSCPSSISFCLPGDSPICVTSLVGIRMKTEGAPPACPVLGQALPPT